LALCQTEQAKNCTQIKVQPLFYVTSLYSVQPWFGAPSRSTPTVLSFEPVMISADTQRETQIDEQNNLAGLNLKIIFSQYS
jgi:hypothetical protein